jgi:microcystin-dependent protein
MGLLEDLNSGKYNLVLFGIIFVILFHVYSCKQTKEPMADVSVDIKEAIKQVYLADVEAIRNLSEVATKLQKDGLTIPGNLTVTGSFNYLPRGSIIAYNSSSAPAGWALCDGSNGTPNLRGRFIFGSGGSRGMNTTGGQETVALNINEMPSHNHGASVSDPGHTHNLWHSNDQQYLEGGISAPKMAKFNYGGTVIKSNTTGISVGISHTGGNQAHENMPPFYVLTYIMKL